MKATAFVVAAALAATAPAAAPIADAPPGEAVAFVDLPGFADDDHRQALAAFRVSCVALASGAPPLRTARASPASLMPVCAALTAHPPPDTDPSARQFFETHFTPRRIGAAGSAFFTGYYEPVVAGSLVSTTAFPTPLRAPPADLVTAAPGQSFPGLDPALTTARRRPDGTFVALPDRAGIEAGALGDTPIAFVRDPVEAFFIQVQGSARIALPDGTLKRLVYAGRNGYPYTSIGKILVDTLHIPPAEMGLTQLEAWIREHGEGPGEAGTNLMQKNRSYIFFAFDDTLPATAGPIGGSGVSLTALRSIAIDRTLWAYGLPFDVEADLPWDRDDPSPFRRLMIAQDTGSAIIGSGRADLFFGTGPEAAHRAGAIRHPGSLYVLWPRGEAAAP